MSEVRKHILSRLVVAEPSVSGDVLAEELGISRVAVWKHIEKLRQQGVDIQSIAGKGYVLNSDIISQSVLMDALQNNHRIGRDVVALDCVDSTNAETMRRFHEGAREGLVVIADEQTKGKGRLGRSWKTLPGSIAMSLLLQPPVTPEKVTQLPILTAVAIHQALQPWVPDVAIKWPNDLLVHKAKLSGILTEMRSEPGQVQAVVIGVGVNMMAPVSGWQQAQWLTDQSGTTRQATDIATYVAKMPKRMQVIEAILRSLDDWYDLWLNDGFNEVRRYWWKNHVSSGQQVVVKNGAYTISGIAEALDDDGALLLRCKKELKRVVSGDLENTNGQAAP